MQQNMIMWYHWIFFGQYLIKYITGEPLALSVENYSRGTLLRVCPA